MANRCGSCDYLNHSETKWGGEMIWCNYKGYYVKPGSVGCDEYTYHGHRYGRYLITAVCDILNLSQEQSKKLTSSFDKVVFERIPQNEYIYDYIRQYDAIGPAIADELRKDSFKETIADSMLSEYILPACDNIHDGDFEYGISRYALMTEKLFDYYFATDKNKPLVRKR